MPKRSAPPSAGLGAESVSRKRRGGPRPRKGTAGCRESPAPLAVLVGAITERKLPRVALRRLQAEFERQVADRTSQLAEANATLQEQVTQLRAEQKVLLGQLQASDHERRLVAYELHDGVSQQLLGAKMLFESHQRSLGQQYRETGAAYHQGMEALVRAAAEVRSLMSRRRNPVLERDGLVAAIAACEEYLAGRYRIEVLDLVDNPGLAQEDQVVAIPTLVRRLPQPIRRVIGDLANSQRVLAGLEIRTAGEECGGRP